MRFVSHETEAVHCFSIALATTVILLEFHRTARPLLGTTLVATFHCRHNRQME